MGSVSLFSLIVNEINMSAPSLNLFFLSFLFALVLLILSTILNSKLKPDNLITLKKILMTFFLAIFIRFLAILSFPFASGYDIDSFIWAAQKVLSGSDIYWNLTVRYHFAFLPSFALLTAWFNILSSLSKIPLVIFIKGAAVLFDSLIAVLLTFISRNNKKGLIYALCPIPLIVSAYIGQFDAIPLFFSLLGLYLFTTKKPVWSMVCIGIGVTFKPWPLLFALPVLFKTKGELRKLSLLIYLSLPAGLILVLYKLLIPSGNLFTMIASIALYESVIGWWGPSLVFQKLADFFHLKKLITLPAFISKILTIALIFYLCEKLKKVNIFVLGKLIILAIYVLSFGLSIHYLLWILPFALITSDKMTKYYLIFAGIYFLFFGTFNILNYNFTPPQIPGIIYNSSTFLLWIFFLIWGIYETRRNLFGEKD